MSTLGRQLRALGGTPGVVATVLETPGATAQRVGATMVVDDAGHVVGGLTIGGCVDARVVECARDVLARDQAQTIRVSLGEDDAVALGLACAGELVVRLEPAASIAPDDHRLRDSSDTTILVVGAGEIAATLVPMLDALGWRAIACDPRETHALALAALPTDERSSAWPSDEFDRLASANAPGLALVILAHDYRLEVSLLERALVSDAWYVGMLGSRRRAAAMRELLLGRAVDEGALARLRSPIGLSLGAQTPAEIAVAIAAELVQVRRASA